MKRSSNQTMKRSITAPYASSWREYVITRACALDGELRRLVPHPDSPTTSPDDRTTFLSAQHSLALARDASGLTARPSPAEDPCHGEPVRPRRRNRLVEAWTGSQKTAAFGYLHCAEIAALHLLPPVEVDARLPDASAKLGQVVTNPCDPRRLILDAELVPPRRPPADPSPSQNGDHPDDRDAKKRKAILARAFHTAYDISDLQHTRVRNLRNILLLATIVLVLTAGIVSLVGAWRPTSLPLCFGMDPSESSPSPACPTRGGADATPSGGDVSLVVLLGALGGALSATIAIRKLRATATPGSLGTALAVMKVPFGGLAALVGILLIHGDFVPGLSELDNQGQIVAYAIAFGFAQQLVTRLIDRHASSVLDAIPDKEQTAAVDVNVLRTRSAGSPPTEPRAPAPEPATPPVLARTP